MKPDYKDLDSATKVTIRDTVWCPTCNRKEGVPCIGFLEQPNNHNTRVELFYRSYSSNTEVIEEMNGERDNENTTNIR